MCLVQHRRCWSLAKPRQTSASSAAVSPCRRATMAAHTIVATNRGEPDTARAPPARHSDQGSKAETDTHPIDLASTRHPNLVTSTLPSLASTTHPKGERRHRPAPDPSARKQEGSRNIPTQSPQSQGLRATQEELRIPRLQREQRVRRPLQAGCVPCRKRWATRGRQRRPRPSALQCGRCAPHARSARVVGEHAHAPPRSPLAHAHSQRWSSRPPCVCAPRAAAKTAGPSPRRSRHTASPRPWTLHPPCCQRPGPARGGSSEGGMQR